MYLHFDLHFPRIPRAKQIQRDVTSVSPRPIYFNPETFAEPATSLSRRRRSLCMKTNITNKCKNPLHDIIYYQEKRFRFIKKKKRFQINKLPFVPSMEESKQNHILE